VQRLEIGLERGGSLVSRQRIERDGAIDHRPEQIRRVRIGAERSHFAQQQPRAVDVAAVIDGESGGLLG